MIALSTFGNLIEKMAKISIIVPIYSVEKYLQRCIASLRNQTFKDIEIILVDDESPDNCPSMCDEYAKADSRIKVIHKKNGGLGYARNSGLEIASGDYVAFVDSDDYVELDMIETLYQECEANKLDAVFADFYVDGNDGFKKSPSFEKLYVNKEQMEELRLDLLGAEPEFPSCSKIQYSVWRGLYSMKLIKKNNLRFPSEREYISEDIVFNLDFLKLAQRAKMIPSKFYHYCFNGTSLTHTYRKDRWDKQIFLLKYLKSLIGDFSNQEEFMLRLGRTALAYSKIAITQELRRNISFSGKIKAIDKIIKTQDFLSFIEKYPIGRLPLKWKLFAYLVHYKLSIILYFLVR